MNNRHRAINRITKRNNNDDCILQDELEGEELYFWVPHYYRLKKDN